MYFWLSKLNVSQPICHAHFWEKTKTKKLGLPSYPSVAGDTYIVYIAILYRIKLFKASYSVIYIMDIFVIQIQNYDM